MNATIFSPLSGYVAFVTYCYVPASHDIILCSFTQYFFFFRFAVSTRWERTVAESGPVKDCHVYCCCFARRIGNMFVLWQRRDGSPVVIAGPCWQFCCFVTVPLILGISGAISYFLIFNEKSPLVRATHWYDVPVCGSSRRICAEIHNDV